MPSSMPNSIDEGGLLNSAGMQVELADEPEGLEGRLSRLIRSTPFDSSGVVAQSSPLISELGPAETTCTSAPMHDNPVQSKHESRSRIRPTRCNTRISFDLEGVLSRLNKKFWLWFQSFQTHAYLGCHSQNSARSLHKSLYSQSGYSQPNCSPRIRMGQCPVLS